MESENNIGSDEHQKMHSDDNNNNNGNTSKPEYNYHSSSPSSSSSSSSASASSSDSNPLEIDIDEKDTNEHDYHDQSPTPEWNSSTTLPTVSPPPVQVMGRPAGYDPHRIPSSVFVSKPASAMEWSMTSNESLFSIHMGNTSFSREQFNLMKSGELKSPEEWMSSTSSLPPINEKTKTNEPSLSAVIEAPSESVDKDSVEYDEACETPNVAASKVSAGENGKGEHFGAHIPNGHGNPPASRLSDGSAQSNMSFAFPVFGGETPNKAMPKKQEPERMKKPVENKWFLYFSCCTFWR